MKNARSLDPSTMHNISVSSVFSFPGPGQDNKTNTFSSPGPGLETTVAVAVVVALVGFQSALLCPVPASGGWDRGFSRPFKS